MIRRKLTVLFLEPTTIWYKPQCCLAQKLASFFRELGPL